MEIAAGSRATQVQIRLKSRDAEIELPPETGAILVSTELKRYQLSTLVNRLLETENPIPLEFLINGQFLRTSIDEFLTENGISAETVLNVEYVKALVPPLHVTSYEHDDWISSVDVLSKSSKAATWANITADLPNRILSASFDGSISIWNESQEVIASSNDWHRGSIQAAKWLSPTSIVSAGNDKSVTIWKYEDAATGKGNLTPNFELIGHTSVIDSIAVHAPSSRILSGSSDNRIGIWSTKKSEAPPAPEPAAQPATKRRKITISTAQRGALSFLTGHQAPVRDVRFDETHPSIAYSASQDHTVKWWDLTTSECKDTRTTPQALNTICHLPSHSLLAAGGTMNRIDLIDFRAATLSILSCRGHKNWIRSLSPAPPQHPAHHHQFVSASDDGTCRIWDLRSTTQEAGGGTISKPVYTIERESAKGKQQQKGKIEQGAESTVYSVCWNQEVGIVSGGQDKMLQINS